MMTEEKVAKKVIDLMETLDQLKKYNVITKSLKKFSAIIGCSFIIFFAVLTLFEILEFEHILNLTQYFVVDFLSLLIPVAGLLYGAFFMRKQINSVHGGEWRIENSKGFSSTLKLLADLDWEKTLEEISNGRVSYAIYGFLKTGTYIVVAVSAFELLWNVLTLTFLERIISAGALLFGLSAILLVLILLAKDILKRYRELRELETLVWELRWFSVEFGRAEFQT